jgi:hypothetical protein
MTRSPCPTRVPDQLPEIVSWKVKLIKVFPSADLVETVARVSWNVPVPDTGVDAIAVVPPRHTRAMAAAAVVRTTLDI